MIGMSQMAIIFFVCGFLFLGFEIVVPGGILGFIGAVCLLGGSISVWVDHGSAWGMAALLGSGLASLLFFYLEIRLLRTSFLAKRFFLDRQTPPASAKSAAGIAAGTKGRALTRLNPSGLVMVAGRKLEAISRDGLIEAGVEVTVVADDPFRIEVRR
jgi:membrane-bound serine protease (ClpP class)